MKKLLLAGSALMWMAGTSLAADCPAVTVADMMGVGAGAYPHQYELAEIQSLANCTLTFREIRHW